MLKLNSALTRQILFTPTRSLVSYHGHARSDYYHDIRHDKKWQKQIITREDKIFKKWTDMTIIQWKHWKDHVFKRTDPGLVAQVPEKYGEYMYFI